MTGITNFLRARIDEDEAVARAACPGPWIHTQSSGLDQVWHYVSAHEATVASIDTSGPDAKHIARHDPERVLAECKAKRVIVDDFAHLSEMKPGPLLAHAYFAARAIAAPYAGHPDFRPEWKL